jgi:DNA invertase Pin-like site-specific DNA recombinase
MKRSPRQARAAEKLRHWESGHRDDTVREAAAAGLSRTRIQKITGLDTTTIMRILNKPPRPRP